jgi:hypothetical protein
MKVRWYQSQKNYNDADLVHWIYFDHHCDDENGFVTALERRRTSNIVRVRLFCSDARSFA